MFYYWKWTKPKHDTIRRSVPESVPLSTLRRSVPAAPAEDGTPREDLLIRLLKLSISYEDYERDHEIDTKHLEMGESLGDGQFGWVQLGTLKKSGNCLTVAVKKSKKPNDRYEQEMFMAELTVMCVIQKHPNILALVGGVTSTSPNMIVMEYVDGGNLLYFLRNSRKNFKNILVSETVDGKDQKTVRYTNNGARSITGQNYINTLDLISYAYQIANGMLQLAKIPCVHRDIAARNILIAGDGTIRIADFGLARKYGSKEYYTPRNEDPYKTPKPWLWMAPEAFNNNKFTEKSDVWSFGVCLFELFTLGKTPIVDGVYRPFWKESLHLPEPEYCPSIVYNHMKICCDSDKYNRPTFSSCLDFFREQMVQCSNEEYQDLMGRLSLVHEKQKSLVTVMHEKQKSLERNGCFSRFFDSVLK